MSNKSSEQVKKSSFVFSIKKFVYSKFIIRYKILKKKIYQINDRNEDKKKIMVNIGGGYFFKRHWSVLDVPSKHYKFMRGVVDYECDLTSGQPLPLEDDSVSFIYSSHTLEHIPQECIPFLFSELYRILKRKGVIRLTMPDFDKAVDAFANNNKEYFILLENDTIEEDFLDYFATNLKNKVPAEELRNNFNSMSFEEFGDFYTIQVPREAQKESSGNHINWWNYNKLYNLLKEAGFNNIYRSEANQSKFSEIRNIGKSIGFDSTHPEISLFVEGVK